MALQNFLDFIGPPVSAAWLNAVDVVKHTIFGDASTKAAARTALTVDAPLEIANGGTGVRTLDALIAEVGGGGGGGTSLPSQAAARLKVLQSDGTAALWASKGYIHVNDFYPTGVVAHNGVSHTLASFYGTLAAAQAYYPHATSLTDEFDWCALQAATNYLYDRSAGSNAYNMSAGVFFLEGQYVINKTVVYNHVAVRLTAASVQGGFKFKDATSISYFGPDGTSDDPIPLLDFWVYDETGAPPPGRLNNPASGGIRVQVENISFGGKATSTSSFVYGFSKFISGIRLRQAAFAQITNCHFGGSWLYDAIYCTGPQLFLIISRNFFYAIERDGIAVWGYRGNTSTTTWIYNNEFGYITRYALMLDFSGAVEAMPIIRDNSFEAAQVDTAYYLQNPEWFVQGVVAENCIINGGNLIWSGNRGEVGLGTWHHYYWAHLHLMNCTYSTVENGTNAGRLVLTGNRSSVDRTMAARAMWGGAMLWVAGHTYSAALDSDNNYATPSPINGYYYRCTVGGTAGGTQPTWPTTIGATVTDGGVTWVCAGTVKKYHDITAARNFNACLASDNAGASLMQHLTLRKLYASIVFVLDTVATLGTSGVHHFEDLTFGFVFGTIPVIDGTYGKTATARPVAVARMIDMPSAAVYTNTPTVQAGYSKSYTHYARGVGYYLTSPISWPVWAGTTVYAHTWWGSYPTVIKPTTENGFKYQCIVGGTSGGSEPSWPTTVGTTVTDGGVTWVCMGREYYTAEGVDTRYDFAGTTTRVTSSGVPTVGHASQGDVAVAHAPGAGGVTSWRCTVTGTPGTWAPTEWVQGANSTGVLTTDTMQLISSGVAVVATVDQVKLITTARPMNSQSANYTLLAADFGTSVLHPSGAGAGHTFTIPSNGVVPYAVGTELEIINEDSNSLSIAIATNTMTLEGTTTTGTRTLAQNGRAKARKTSATTWLISGSGLT